MLEQKKRPLFGKRQWVTHKLALMHTQRQWKPLVGQWEYVSSHYSLWFQVFTSLGFIRRMMCCFRVLGVSSATQTEGLFNPGGCNQLKVLEKRRGG